MAMALRDGAVPLDACVGQTGGRVALVLGTEGDGLFESTIEACDRTVIIPMAYEVDSLNVAVAGAIAFWELRR